MALPTPGKLLMVYEDAKRIQATEKQARETEVRKYVESETPKRAATILDKAMKAAEAGRDHHVHEVYNDRLRSAVMHLLSASGYTVAEVTMGSYAEYPNGIRIDFDPAEEKPCKKRSWWRVGIPFVR